MTTVYKSMNGVKTAELHKIFRSMEKQSNVSFAENLSKTLKLKFEYSADLRYRGQGNDLRVSLPGPARSLTPEKISKLFGREYERTYGYSEDEENIQLINLRVVASLATKKPILKKAKASTKVILKSANRGKRKVYFTEFKKFVNTTVYDGHHLRPGNLMKGPAIVELKTTTIVLRPEQKLRIDLYGNFIVARRGIKP